MAETPQLDDQALMNKLFQMFIPPVFPPELFHYTNAQGVIGITTKAELWASDLRHVNDKSELTHAYEPLEQMLNQRLSDTAIPKSFINGLHTFTSNFSQYRVYAISLSEDGDALGQWRGYCSNGQGYSIGFPYKPLQKYSGSLKQWVLAQCIYSTEHKNTMTRWIVNTIVERAETLFSNGSTTVEQEANIMALLARMLRFILPFFKHESFQDEKEWRLVRLANPRETLTPKIRAGKGGLLPYAVFPLINEQNQVAASTLFVGPSNHTELALDAAEQLASTSKLQIQTVKLSTIPYRVY